MFNRLGKSSEIYHILPEDIISLPDYKNSINIKDSIVVIISDNGDELVCGRELVENAINDGLMYVPVRFIFKMRYPIWKLHITLIKKLRDRKRIKGSGIYHISPKHIRSLGIERAYRNINNAHKHAASMKHPDYKNLYNNLKVSIIKNGYDDRYPMDIQLCRSLGVQDTLNQGHHRMGILIENNIETASVSFSAVGYIPNPFRLLLLKIAKNMLSKKREES